MGYLRAQSFGVDGRRTGRDVRANRAGDARLRRGAQRPALRDRDRLPGLQAGAARRQPAGGRSLSPVPYDVTAVGEWADRITSFPADWSNVGFDAETRARLHAEVDDQGGELVRRRHRADRRAAQGSARRRGDGPCTEARAEELIADGGRSHRCTNRRRRRQQIACGRAGASCWAPAASSGIRVWCRRSCAGPMHGAVSPPNNTGDGLRMAMAHGADLANMGEAWWVPIVQIPGDTIDGKQRSRSVRLERTRPRSIIVNRAGKRFVNEACDYNSMAGAFHYLDPRGGYVNDPAWIVFDSIHLKRYGFLGIAPGEPVPDWFCESADLAELARQDRHRRRRADPHDRSVEPQRRRRRRSRLRPRLQRLRRLLGRRHGHHARRQDAGPDRHRAVLRGAGLRRRDGHQGRTTHRPRRPGAARQR